MATKYDAIEEMKSEIGYNELLQVLDFYGIEVRRKKILCPFPGHNDRHIGNCSVTDRGYIHCFACGKNTDAIGLVSIKEGLGFSDAIEYLWTKILCRQLPESFHAKKKGYTPIRLNDLRLIGLGNGCGRYVPAYVGVADAWDVDRGKEKVPDGCYADFKRKDLEGDCPVYRKERTDSIYDLIKENPDVAKGILLGKCKETTSYYQSILRSLKDPNTEYGRTAMADPDFLEESKTYCFNKIEEIQKVSSKVKSLR